MPYSFGVETYLLNEVDPPDAHQLVALDLLGHGRGGRRDHGRRDRRRARREDPVAFRLRKLSGAGRRRSSTRWPGQGNWGRPMPARPRPGRRHPRGVQGLRRLPHRDRRHRSGRAPGHQGGRRRRRRAVHQPAGLEAQLIGHIMDGISVDAVRREPPGRRRHQRVELLRLPLGPNAAQSTRGRGPHHGADRRSGRRGRAGLSRLRPAAVANAYARATGTHPRSFPIVGEGA